ncbi:hypothetical protein [Kluyvera cryocrescens]|uniref:hypothetical protein n=1 Tax=Kluyvera cryocrescens TaxID=580 RepID=UPI002DB5CD7C|nr:hypothetical protein [Kluyvera cryocrescens]MEB6632744.1 hypothetical protein [Kluyvera cryocrescens]
MLENYNWQSREERNRGELLKVAVEIIKASVSAPSNYDGKDKLDRDIKHTIENIESLVATLQKVIEKE